MTHLFLFTLSPVQSFIAQARKAQDLYAGSRILSTLAKTAAETARKQGIGLIIPTETGGISFPHRFLGKIEGSYTKDDLQLKGAAIEKAVQEKFQEFADNTLKTIKLTAPKGFDTQIREHLDINWLFYPINANYEKAYKEIDHLMAALKNERHISNQHPEKGRKCSLDGERNALFFGRGTNENYVELNGARIVSEGIWLKPNEGLSAVSMMKRAYNDEGRKFPSTAKVALSYQMNNLDQKQVKWSTCYRNLFSENYMDACTALIVAGELTQLDLKPETFQNWRKDKDFDDQLFYEENLNEKEVPDPIQLGLARLLQKKIAKKLTHKYYALISFDGDKMGTLLSGETRTDKSGDLSLFQGRVSERLGAFSKWIYKDLDNPSGESQNGKMDVVYAGGDDFLGLANLNDLFEVVKKLHEKFNELVNVPLRPELESDINITFSMGIAIAHYKEPLNMVLQTAREMEKLAKNKGKRNAFAIATLKHSGDKHQAFFKWGADNGVSQWDALKELVEHFQNGCSDTFARSLEREFYALQDSKGEVENLTRTVTFLNSVTGQKEEVPIKMFEIEMIRLIGRSWKRDSTRPSKLDEKGEIEELRKTVMRLFEDKSTRLRQSIAVKNGIEAVKVALFLKRNNKIKKETSHGHQD